VAAGLLGIDPTPFLTADRLKSQVLNEVVNQAVEFRNQQLKSLTIEIANNLGKVLGG